MTRSRLKNRTNKSRKEEDLKVFKRQRNLVLKLNRKKKRKTSSKFVSSRTIKWKIKNFGSFGNPFLQRRVRNTTEILS